MLMKMLGEEVEESHQITTTMIGAKEPKKNFIMRGTLFRLSLSLKSIYSSELSSLSSKEQNNNVMKKANKKVSLSTVGLDARHS